MHISYYQQMANKNIESEALNLPSTERALLALDLIESLDCLPPSENEALWEAESARRAAHLDTGEAVAISYSEVRESARELLK